MPLINMLTRGNFSQHRKVTGAPVAADSTDHATIVRANILRTDGAAAVKGYVRFTGGAAPTVDLIPLLYDADTNTFCALTKIAGLLDGQAFEVNVHECPVYFRIDAVANAPTAIEIRVAPGELTMHA